MNKSKLFEENNKERGLIDDTYQNSFNRLCEKTISYFTELLYLKKIQSPTLKEQELINELRENTKEFSFVSNGSDAEDEWMKHARRVASLIQADDPRCFLSWNPIKDTMGGSNYFFVIPELNFLKSLCDWRERWSFAIQEDSIGNQSPFFLYPKSSGNLIHHAYVMAKFETLTGKKINEMDFIFDFGGGYGSVCRLVHRLGFKGRYLIFDISVFSFLQQFFLKNIEMPVKTFDDFIVSTNGICCISDYALLKKIFASNIFSSNSSLFIGMWSVSETPLNTRNEIMAHASLFGNYLIGYQDKFGEVDNMNYFELIKSSLPNISWTEERLKQLPCHNLLCGFSRNHVSEECYV